MINIVIIGVGALGKRHLESILNSDIEKKIYCVDINPHALDDMLGITKDEVELYTTIKHIPKVIVDFALFSMSSRGRREMYDELVNHAIVKNIVFEKVLFQTVEDYYWVSRDLTQRGIHAWVNCARRQMNAYQELKRRLADAKYMEVHVTGGNWGLACNSIHMLDMISFVSMDEELKIDKIRLEPKIINSKREGYKEVNGVITGSGSRVREFSISCVQDVTFPLEIEIITDQARYRILESKHVLIEKKHDIKKEEMFEFEMLYQSQMTQYVMEDIVERQESRLTSFKESMKLHLMIIQPMIKFFEERGMEEGKCPIT